jgi:hypothetical protein
MSLRRSVCDQFIEYAPSLEEFPDQSKLWRGRSGRSCVEQRKKVNRDCAILHSRLQARAAIESSTASPQTTEPSPENAVPVRSEISSASSRSHDRGVALAESGEKRVNVGFRCAASCKHSEFLMPSSLCPFQECDGDKNGGGRVHDECAQAVWVGVGQMWSDPSTGDAEFCSKYCFHALSASALRQ